MVCGWFVVHKFFSSARSPPFADFGRLANSSHSFDQEAFFCLVAYQFLKCRLPFVGYRSQLFRISSMDKLKVNVKVVEKTRHIRSFASSSPTSLTKTHVPDYRTKTTVRNHSGEIADVFSNIFVVFALQVMWTTFKWFGWTRKAKEFYNVFPRSVFKESLHHNWC